MENNPVSILAPSFLPSTVVLEMTYSCSHSCLFCSCPWERLNGGFKKKHEMTTDEWKTAIKRLVEMGVTGIAFTGGEPLLKTGIREIIGYASSLPAVHIETVDGALRTTIAPPRLYLISNGSQVNDDVIEWCREMGIALSLSLPGLSTYSAHTFGGSAQRILDLFEKASLKGVHTTANITVTRLNLPELFETIASALIAGAGQLLLNRFLPGGRGMKYVKELSLNAEELNRALDIADEVLCRANRYGSVGTELPRCALVRDDYKHLRVGTTCSAARNFFVVGPSGYVRTCNHSPVELEHITKIDRVKHNPYWNAFVFRQYYPAGCKACSLLFKCDGGCREAAHAEHGKIDAPDNLMKAWK